MTTNKDLLNFKYNNIAPSEGKILLSMPFIQDSYFARSVVFLTEHNKKGSFGFVLNKRCDFKMTDIISDFPSSDYSLTIGGPVGTDTVHFIHTVGDMIPNTVRISPEISWGGDFEVVKELIAEKLIKKEEIRFFIGYSGWSPNQLENELKEDTWIVENINNSIIMNSPIEDIWDNTLISLGGKYELWRNFPSNPILN